MRAAVRHATILVLFGWIASPGCGGETAGGGAAADESAGQATAADSGDSQKIEPCSLLTDEQVATVLSGAKGMTMSAGGSLIEGMDDYQCSWVSPETHTLILVMHVAHNDSSFAQVKPDPERFADARTVSVGDGGWLKVNPQGNPEVTATKGRTLILLELDSPDENSKTDALIELARAVAGKV